MHNLALSTTEPPSSDAGWAALLIVPFIYLLYRRNRSAVKLLCYYIGFLFVSMGVMLFLTFYRMEWIMISIAGWEVLYFAWWRYKFTPSSHDAAEEKFEGDDVYSDLPHPIHKAVFTFVVQVMLMSWYCSGIRKIINDDSREIDLGLRKKRVEYICAAAVLQVLLHIRSTETPAIKIWANFRNIGEVRTLSPQGQEVIPVTVLDLLVRMFMSFSVMVFTKFLITTLPIFLMQAESEREFVKDCLATFIITELDKVKGAPFTAARGHKDFGVQAETIGAGDNTPSADVEEVTIGMDPRLRLAGARMD